MEHFSVLAQSGRRIELTRYQLTLGDRLVLVFVQYPAESETSTGGIREFVFMNPENVAFNEVGLPPALLKHVTHTSGQSKQHAVFEFADSAKVEFDFSACVSIK